MESCIDLDISVFESTFSEIYLPAFVLYDLVHRIGVERRFVVKIIAIKSKQNNYGFRKLTIEVLDYR